MAWGSQMHKTYYGDNYWVPTWTVCAVRCSRLCGQRQRKPVHTSRIQGVLRNLPNKAHNHTAISPKIKRPGWHFVDTLKRALKKASGAPTDNFCRYTPNPNTPLAVSPAETMFARKIRSVFNKLLPKQNKLRKTTLAPKKRFNPGEKIYFKKYQNNTSCWDRGIISKRIGDMVYIVEGPKYTHKRHQNKLQKRRLNDSNDVPQTQEESIDTIFDMFDLDPPQSRPEIRRSGRKRKFTDPLMIDPKRKKY